jgi:FkbM family methyltransferase
LAHSSSDDDSQGFLRRLLRGVGQGSGAAARAIARHWPGGRPMARRMKALEARLARLEAAQEGARATYMGNGLVLVKCDLRGRTLALLVEADDRLIAPWFIVTGRYETELTQHFMATLRPDDRCLDVGANFGYFTCLFARFCPGGKVIGAEPDPRLHAIARDNVHINGLGSVAEVQAVAVCEARRPVLLHRRIGRSGNTSIAPPDAGFTASLGEPPAEPFEAKGMPVNALVRAMDGRVDVMKVDVEGAEPLVFRGARRAIAENPAVQIVMEWSPGQIAAAGFAVPAFLDELAAMGLAVHDLAPGNPPIPRDSLLARPYSAGILLARTPRAPRWTKPAG